MKYDRRIFIRQGGLFLSGLALAGIGCGSSAEEASAAAEPGISGASASGDEGELLERFGIQLYTVRDVLPRDPRGVLRQLASFGYKQIEGYEGKEGIWWGLGREGFKRELDELGLQMVATHCDVKKDFERKAAEAAENGLAYLIQPWVGKKDTLDEYKQVAESFNALGAICKKNGVRFAYHNHGYSFEPLEGRYPQDIMMANTDPELVDFELDIYWVVVPGGDPAAWLTKYPNRFRLCHVKDRLKSAPAGEPDASTEVGNGSIDFRKILRVAKDNGMQYFIVEQERYDNGTSLEAARVSAAYLKTFRF